MSQHQTTLWAIATVGVSAACYLSWDLLAAPRQTKARCRSASAVSSKPSPDQTDRREEHEVPLHVDQSQAKRLNQDHANKFTKPKFTEVEEVYVRGTGWQPAPPPSTLPGSDGDYFIAHHRSSTSGNPLEAATWIEIRHEGLLAAVKSQYPRYSGLYNRQPGIDSRDLFLCQIALQDVCDGLTDPSVRQALFTLLEFVTARFSTIKQKYDVLPAGTITWPLLWWIMPAGQEIEGPHDLHDRLMAYKIDSWQYTVDDRGRAFIIKAHYYQWSGYDFQQMSVTKKIPEFKEIKPLSELEFWPLTQERKEALHARGHLYARRYSSLVYSDYKGTFYTRMLTGTSRLSGTGRVMVDVIGYRKANPNLDGWIGDVHRDGETPDALQANGSMLSPDLYFLLPPSVHGFSFKAKRWGEFLVDNLSPIEWGENAFEHLVIPDEYRKVIRSLVDVHTGALGSQVITDVVAGKGEGLILALHGRPGTGKTLTAEAVSDHLHTPLYIVSTGELGTTAAVLEKKLSEVLDLATAWKAVLLIDEADIFLEKRAVSHVERNALVGVFLRLLEYYNGVLILTTNRLEEFDEAFASRFSLTLPFPELNRKSRETLWLKVRLLILRCRPELDAAQTRKQFRLDELSCLEVNGRAIKQVIRTSQALALGDGQPLAMNHLRRVMSLTT
ncbi:hypothetical protein EHS25_005166 [Saitozyma podzolica]|uniref:AAA+ ATPase domain-containing protein n=1 Tax=Saitozyma podzolica TaxID=1890683 RepID=A0A427XYN5_9TREE|nr:hypothetical protein EHS25_005166 [Saitozyma podzolica]